MKKRKKKRAPSRGFFLIIDILMIISFICILIVKLSNIDESSRFNDLLYNYTDSYGSELIDYANQIDLTNLPASSAVVGDWQWVHPLNDNGNTCGIQYGGILTELRQFSNVENVVAVYQHPDTAGTHCDTGIMVEITRFEFEKMTENFQARRKQIAEIDAIVLELLGNSYEDGSVIRVTEDSWVNYVNPGRGLNSSCRIQEGAVLREINKNDKYVLVVYDFGYKTPGTSCDRGSLFLIPLEDWE